MHALKNISMPFGFIKYKDKYQLTDQQLILLIVVKFLNSENNGKIDSKQLSEITNYSIEQIEKELNQLVTKKILELKILKLNDKNEIRYCLQKFETDITNLAIEDTQKQQKIANLSQVQKYQNEIEMKIKRVLNEKELEFLKMLIVAGLEFDLFSKIVAENTDESFGQIVMQLKKLQVEQIKTVQEYLVFSKKEPNKTNKLSHSLNELNWLKK